jgi:hypothetical protein
LRLRADEKPADKVRVKHVQKTVNDHAKTGWSRDFSSQIMPVENQTAEDSLKQIKYHNNV